MKMNKYVKEFLRRGLLFGGFGPIITGVVMALIPGVELTGNQILLMVCSTYVLAFVQAGATVFNQIGHWSILRALLCHFSSLYAVYLFCYTVNAWIPFRWPVVGLFTLIFAAVFFTTWLVVYLCVRATRNRLNRNIHVNE